MDKKNVSLNGLNSKSETDLIKLIWNGAAYQMCLAKIVFDDFGAPVDFIILDINPAYEKAFGLSREHAINKKITELFPYFVPEWLEKCGEAVRLNEKLLSVEHIYDPLIWYEAQVFPLGSEDQFITVTKDIKKRNVEKMRIENEMASTQIEALSEQLEILNVLMDNNPSLIFLKDECGRYIYLNNTYEQQFVGSKNWYGKTDFDFWSKESAELFRANDLAVLESGRVTQYLEDSTDANGTRYCWLNYKFPYTDSKKRRYSGGIGIDVTKRIIAEEALRKAEEELQQYAEDLRKKEEEALELVDSFSEGSWILDCSTGTLKCSEKWAKRIGLDRVPEKERAYYANTLIHHENPSDNTIPHCIESGLTRFDLEFRVKTVDSGYIWTQNRGKIKYDAKGKAAKVYAATIDITEQVAAETAKKEAIENSLRMKDEFLTTITHEFKTPLNVINAALQVIEMTQGSQLPDNLNKHLRKIKKNSYRQLRLVNNLLDITRYNNDHLKMELQNFDVVKLTEAITNSVDIYAIHKGVKLFFSSEKDHLEMALDEEKFERILLNLLSNAIKFTPKDRSIYVHVASENKMACITVRDEGIGIPKSKQKCIFERFGQVDSSLSRRAEGTGIGLSLVKSLTSAMKGTVTVSSEIDKGSTFTVKLPIKKLSLQNADVKIDASQDSRIIQAAAIEFSDHYL